MIDMGVVLEGERQDWRSTWWHLGQTQVFKVLQIIILPVFPSMCSPFCTQSILSCIFTNLWLHLLCLNLHSLPSGSQNQAYASLARWPRRLCVLSVLLCPCSHSKTSTSHTPSHFSSKSPFSPFFLCIIFFLCLEASSKPHAHLPSASNFHISFSASTLPPPTFDCPAPRSPNCGCPLSLHLLRILKD